ncbi:interleukin-18 receptor accessory protein [Varanus komodoensis]|uniref:Interleukin 18 receptor accessory protein n=1 Tax=Varanus komodoensis TaxID=61221 RepID=A0A8D2JGL3_VARKO|nr:interleukin-18 receptor accessory protein [Varanus komodoensis]XP_044285160.1 interleukin-18 receptor accessory protein [Varanus komodoensis]XP_044285161.1 interleukin-18 receptor accessory protein [Varanus komodoensis]
MLTFCWLFVLLMNRVAATDVSVTGCLHKHTDARYRAISGQKFVVSCDPPSEDPASIFSSSHLQESWVQWFWQSSDGEVTVLKQNGNSNLTLQGNVLWFNPITVQHSGRYICVNRGKKLPCVNIHIVVQTEKMAQCSDKLLNDIKLLVGQGTSIACPGKSCFGNLSHSVKWYKNGAKVRVRTDIRPGLKIKHNKIELRSVYDKDNGTYTCDYTLTDNNTKWTMRTLIDVTIISKPTINPPKVLDPSDVRTLEVELGKQFELKCEAQFGFEMSASSSMRWLKKTSKNEQQLQLKRVNPKGLEGQIFSLVFKLKEVAEEDLSSHFICLAQNSVGNSTGMFKLRKKKEKALHFLLTLCCTIIFLLGVILGGTLTYWHWIELVLFYRNYLAKDETLNDCKEFDAFVSYAKPETPEANQELYNEEQFAIEFLPQVLENEYGYKLCLSERDILPGGAYTDDIVNAIKKSRRAIMILSTSYVKNEQALFELEAAVNAVLEDKTIKLILIQFESFQKPESLPQKVKKALRILPRITWKTASSPTANKQFWKKLQYYMPVKHKRGAQDKWFSFPHLNWTMCFSVKSATLLRLLRLDSL